MPFAKEAFGMSVILIILGEGDIIYDCEGFVNPGDEKYSGLGGAFVADLALSGDLHA